MNIEGLCFYAAHHCPSYDRDPTAALKPGDFDGLTSLEELYLNYNRLTTLPAGVFDNLTRLQALLLNDNHLVGLTRINPLFANLPDGAYVRLDGQTDASGSEVTYRLKPWLLHEGAGLRQEKRASAGSGPAD